MLRKNNPKILAIIPARGGSKGVPRKNIRLLGGKPLIAWTIESAKKSKYLDRIIVSTEDKEIAEISKRYGAEVIERPEELAKDDASSLSVLTHVVDFLEKNENYKPDIIVVLQPTSPMRKEQDIDNAIEKLIQTNCDSVVSICEFEHSPYWAYKLNEDKIEYLIKSKYNTVRRQDLPKIYRPNGAVYVTRRKILMGENKVLGKDTRATIMPLERSVDIDTELDFKFAEFLMNEKFNL